MAAGLLAGCAGPSFIGQWSLGLAELPASRGWVALPIGNWVLNEGLDAQALVFCPRTICPQPGFAALLAFDGPQASALERALAADERTLASAFSRPTDRRKPARSKSRTGVTRFSQDGAAGLLVEIAARDSHRRAFAALIFARESGRLRLAFAAAETSEGARADAASAWRSR